MIVTALVFLASVGLAYGLAYWAFRARHDRSAYVGLYLLFGFPGLLLTVAGLALVVYGSSGGWILLLLGLGFSLPLLRPVRQVFATFTQIDPASPVDMTGLCILLPVLAYLGVSFVSSGDADEGTVAVSEAELVVQVLAFIALAYAAVGTGFFRSVREATARLGIRPPNIQTFPIAVGFMFLAFLINGVASVLTREFQPETYERIEQVASDMTANVQNIPGALLLGLSAGIGEEILLRGALQPRFGILLTSLLFALLHVQYGLALVLVGLFLTGVLLGLERRYFGTTAAILTHALFNTIVVLGQAAA